MTPFIWKRILNELDFRYSRSSGPGGQHVNKTESKAEVRWNLAQTQALTEDQKARALAELQTLLKKGEFIIVTSEEYRSREQNKEICISKLKKMIEKALFIPKKRIKTKPSKAAKTKRIESKKQRGEIKKTRKRYRF